MMTQDRVLLIWLREAFWYSVCVCLVCLAGGGVEREVGGATNRSMYCVHSYNRKSIVK